MQISHFLYGMLLMLYLAAASFFLLGPLCSRLFHYTSHYYMHRDWPLRLVAAGLLLYLSFDLIVYYSMIGCLGDLTPKQELFTIALDGMILPFYHFLNILIIRYQPLSARLVLLHLTPFVLLAGLCLFFDLTPCRYAVYVAYVAYAITFFVLDIWRIIRTLRLLEDRLGVHTTYWCIIRYALPSLEGAILAMEIVIDLCLVDPWGGTAYLIGSLCLMSFIIVVMILTVYKLENLPADSIRSLDRLRKEPEAASDAKYMTEAEKREFLDQLQRVCVDKMLYCNPTLRREDLVRAMHTNTTYFSERLQICTGKNFYMYINDLRLDRAMTLLKSQPALSVDQVMRLSGFLSSTTFYRLFRERYACTPLQYRRSK